MSAVPSLAWVPSGRTSFALLTSLAVHGLLSVVGLSGAVSTKTQLPEQVLVDLLPSEEPAPEPAPAPQSSPPPEPEPSEAPPLRPPMTPPVAPPEPPAPLEPPETDRTSSGEPEPNEEVAGELAGEPAESAPSASVAATHGLDLRLGSPRGSGAPSKARRGVGRPRAPRPPAPPPAAPLPLADLGTRPRPPLLDDVLERNFPASARLQGRSGTARVALLIDREGQVRSVRGVSATAPEFEAACKKTLLGSRWTVPRDATGTPVPTIVPYECRFQVAR